MNSKDFEAVIKAKVETSVETLFAKNDGYATSDRLHNFKVAAVMQQESPIKALGGMMAKHTVSIYDLIEAVNRGEDVSIELWDEKIGDHINYLLLLWAAIVEEKKLGGSLNA